MLIVPKTTRRALAPDSGTSSGCPRGPQAARSGGNSSRSVSSSNSLTQRAGSLRQIRRRRRFFLALGVGVQHVAGPLPDVIQLVQEPADRGRGRALAAPAREVFLQQRDGPRHGLVTEAIRRLRQAG